MSQIINELKSKLKDWNSINWKKVRRNVMNLQRRIFRARKLAGLKQKSAPNKAQTLFISYEYINIFIEPLEKTI